MNHRTAVITVWLMASWLVGHAVAAPVPDVAPKSWELSFDFVDPQTITLQLPGYDRAQTFWYMLYTVTNNTGREVQFLPRFELMTNTMQVLPGDPGVHPMVFEAIKRRHRPTHPLLIEPVRIMGRLLQGPDNARSSVVIWPQFDIRANQFTVYIAGLSGESALVPNPDYKPGQPEFETKKLGSGAEIRVPVNPRYFTLRKTLAIRYLLPGDEQTRAQARVGRLGTDWVMR
ncbi:MAG: hypothetical protein JXQ73_24125 [Phycisphaerae bacterium]|nr:hypothetical protein [Phycisphaerae bacterium]